MYANAAMAPGMSAAWSLILLIIGSVLFWSILRPDKKMLSLFTMGRTSGASSMARFLRGMAMAVVAGRTAGSAAAAATPKPTPDAPEPEPDDAPPPPPMPTIGPERALPALIKAFGRDPLQVAQAMLGSQVQQGATQNQAVVYDPRVDRLEAELQAREQRDLLSRIDAFAKDPANPHFEAVRQDMGLLIQANPELSLKQAYEKAVWSNDATRQKLIADEKAKADADRTKAAAEAKAKRDRAASSVRNAPTSAGSARRATNNNSIEDDLNAAIEAVGWA